MSKVAVLIDADNVSAIFYKQIEAQVDKFVKENNINGVLRHAFGGPGVKGPWQEATAHVLMSFTEAVGPNGADFVLAMEAARLQTYGVQSFFICSSDNDFVAVVQELNSKGAKVIGISPEATRPKTLGETCDKFITMRSPNAPKKPTPAPAAKPKPTPPPKKVAPVTPVKATPMAVRPRHKGQQFLDGIEGSKPLDVSGRRNALNKNGKFKLPLSPDDKLMITEFLQNELCYTSQGHSKSSVVEISTIAELFKGQNLGEPKKLGFKSFKALLGSLPGVSLQKAGRSSFRAVIENPTSRAYLAKGNFIANRKQAEHLALKLIEERTKAGHPLLFSRFRSQLAKVTKIELTDKALRAWLQTSSKIHCASNNHISLI